jgi:formate--tetrahydrofolate ligase
VASGANVPSDLEIAQAAQMQPIVEVAAKIGLTADDLEAYGKYKAKVHLSAWPPVRTASTSMSPLSHQRR